MKTNRRGFIAGIVGGIVAGVAKPVKAVSKFSSDKYDYFKASEMGWPFYMRVFLDGKEIHDVSEMLAAKEPNVTVHGFVIVFEKDSHGYYKLKRNGNKEYATLITKKIEGMIRWEPICSNTKKYHCKKIYASGGIIEKESPVFLNNSGEVVIPKRRVKDII